MSNKKKRIPDLDEDEELITTQFSLSEKYYDKLGEEALKKKVSKASIVRKLLKNHFNESARQKVKLSVKLDKILKDCDGFWGGFEIDGDDGFIEMMFSEGLMLEDLSSDEWKMVFEKIEVGYDGYNTKPSSNDFVSKFLKLKPTEEQIDCLSSLDEGDEEED